jgi:hypothetical protein
MSSGDKYIKKEKGNEGKFERKRKRKMKHVGKIETKKGKVNVEGKK